MSEKIERLFNIYGFSGGSFAGNVYGIDGIAPTLNCAGGGNRMPLILIEDEREEYRRQETENLASKIAGAILINTDSNGNAKAIRACYGQCGFDSVFRGGGQGITGVMEEVEAKIVGYSRDSEIGKVKSRHLKELANTITTCTGSGNNCDQYVAEPKIAASRGRGESNRQQLEINDRGTSNTITSVNKDNLLIEPNVLRAERTEKCKHLRKMNGDKGMKFNQGNKEYNPRTDGVSNTLSTSTKDNMLAVPELRMEDGCMVDKDGHRYRIRKLTPTECFRLMDVEDEDIEKMKQAGIAKTNLYKLAGNSIVVSCMYHIFRKLFIEKECENEQLSLF